MNRSSLFACLIFTRILFSFGSATGNNCEGVLEIDLQLESSIILSYGVVVGNLVFVNSGETRCNIGGSMSIDAGHLNYDLELPSGEIVKLKKYDHKNRESVQYAELFPGDQIYHPVCIMKFNNKYLFTEVGLYRIRASYLASGSPKVIEVVPCENSGRVITKQTEAPVLKVNSDWVEIVVQPRGRGRTKFLNSHPRGDVVGAFKFRKGFEIILDQLSSFGDYRHEQEKLLVYQLIGPRVVGGILVEQEYNEELIAEAKEVLLLAQKSGVGVSLWEWIVGRLEEPPKEASGREKWNARNGYFF